MKNNNCYSVMKIIVAASLCLFLLAGCGAKDVAPGDLPKVTEENHLVVYTSHKSEVFIPIIREFEERYGIFVEVYDGGTNEMLEKISSDAEIKCDVMFGGGIETLRANSKLFSETELFTSLPMVIIYNNKLVYSESSPDGYEDLLDLRWRGKIAFADPCKSGSSYTALMTLTQLLSDRHSDVVSEFAEQLCGNVLSGSGDVVSAVSSGTKLVGITLLEAAQKSIASGADINIVFPCEGTSDVPDGVAIVKDCQHEKNAKLFLDFVTSTDVQQYAVDNLYRRSTREDIEPSVAFSEAYPDRIKGELKFFDYDLVLASESQSKLLERWSELVSE